MFGCNHLMHILKCNTFHVNQRCAELVSSVFLVTRLYVGGLGVLCPGLRLTTCLTLLLTMTLLCIGEFANAIAFVHHMA